MTRSVVRSDGSRGGAAQVSAWDGRDEHEPGDFCSFSCLIAIAKETWAEKSWWLERRFPLSFGSVGTVPLASVGPGWGIARGQGVEETTQKRRALERGGGGKGLNVKFWGFERGVDVLEETGGKSLAARQSFCVVCLCVALLGGAGAVMAAVPLP